METEGMEIIWLELKYCERCGGLWMRVRGTDDVYCPSCVSEMLDFPTTRRKRKPQLLLDDGAEIKSQSEELPPICGEWGNA
jgi:hypothetical protein